MEKFAGRHGNRVFGRRNPPARYKPRYIEGLTVCSAERARPDWLSALRKPGRPRLLEVGPYTWPCPTGGHRLRPLQPRCESSCHTGKRSGDWCLPCATGISQVHSLELVL